MTSEGPDPPKPPKKGRPSPPRTGRPDSPSPNVESPAMRARRLENDEKYSEAAIIYQEIGDMESANRCLRLQLVKSQGQTVNNIHIGDRIVRDSVVTGKDSD